MFIDASALVAMIAEEREGAEFAERLRDTNALYTSPIAVYEATLALQRIRKTAIDAVTQFWMRFWPACASKRFPSLQKSNASGITIRPRFWPAPTR